ncbi:MAG: Mce-associated rane protein [Mycobacterium sp.]|nr:Mce-associated rane protein [Mycobacterium sp.]
MVAFLASATLSALTLGGVQTYKGARIDAADDSAARQTVLDAAKSTTVKMLTYTPDNVDQLTSVLPQLTGKFRDTYSDLIKSTVIPAAHQNNVTATADVAAVGVESLTPDEAAVIAYIDQTVTVGTEAPTDTASSFRLGLKLIDGHWLVEKFDPI